MAKLGKVVYLTEAQKETLFSEGTVTVDGTTVTYSANDLYLTPTDSKVNKSGDTITGILNLTSNLVKVRDYGSTATSIVYVDTTESVHRNIFTTSVNNVFGFRQYNKAETSPTLAAGTYYEGYLLPNVSTGLTGNQSYNIITDKPGEQFVYKATETFTSSSTSTARPIWNGFVSSNGKTLYLNVIVNKSMASISSIAVTTFTGAIYGVGGAIESSTTSTAWATNYTCTATKASDYIVRITITKSDSTVFSSATSSTPLVGSISTVLTFS